MKKILLLFAIPCNVLFAQNSFKAVLKDGETKEPLVGATALFFGTTNGSTADLNGLITISNIPDGKQIIVFRYLGYEQRSDTFNFPLPSIEPINIFLQSSKSELEEVVVSSTRSSRTIDDIPTRIETIAAGELEEKSVMQPGSIKMLLTESTGIQTQQTSQVSGSSSIRIQGLDGKYTQLLQDGFPLYSGFSSGLSILQIPPLNLKRVEVIKGSASTLYGGGAIAGLINLITKEPTDKRELSLLVNGNQTQALDVSSFYSERYKKTGLTIYAAGNLQNAYDANKDGFSDIPKFNRYTISPKFFYYPNSSTVLSIGLNAGIEDRTGGDMKAITAMSDTAHSFFEKNTSNRYSSQIKFVKTFSNKHVLSVKNSVGYFDRKIARSAYTFQGNQIATYSELNYLIPKERSEWNLGVNYITDDFKQTDTSSRKLNYFNTTFGGFAQNTFNLSKRIILETGLRADITNRNDIFLLPRLSMLFKINQKLSSRIGGGLGYKSPTVFSEEAEERAFQYIQPLDYNKIHPERSTGFNADLNYKTGIGEKGFFSINQMFFYTVLQKPLILVPDQNLLAFENANGTIETQGFETNAKIKYGDFSCFIGYTFIDAKRKFKDTTFINPLTAKHRINANVMYEWEEKLRIAYEVFYIGEQYLTTGEKTRDYWVMGISAERKFKHFSLFVNFENFLDVRQSKWEPMYNGGIQNPQFREIYTPTDGIIFNGGFKLTL